MNVGGLKKILAELPDDVRVLVKDSDGSQGDIHNTEVCWYAVAHDRPNYTCFWHYDDDEQMGESSADDEFDKLDKPVLMLEATAEVGYPDTR